MALVSTSQLKAARALAGLTQTGLGDAMGVDERQIRFWEKRLPKNQNKRKAIQDAFSAIGVEFVSTPTIGVCMTGNASH